MENLTFAYTLYSVQLRMIFGGKFRYQKEYDHALDALGVTSHWLYLYKSLEGPQADQVCVALEKWVTAFEEKADNEKELKRDVHVLIYGKKYREGWHGYVE